MMKAFWGYLLLFELGGIFWFYPSGIWDTPLSQITIGMIFKVAAFIILCCCAPIAAVNAICAKNDD